MSECMLCPRECRADREGGALGFCGVGSKIKIARAAPHFWEEPIISGSRGSGTVFFSGCSLRCVFCQNKKISHGTLGREIDEAELERIIFGLCDEGVHNINFVTPTHYADKIARLLEKIKPSLPVPVVWNTSGYEKAQTLDMLDGLVDIYLPDFKYFDPELGKKYSAAPDYQEVASAAIERMFSQVGKCRLGEDGLLKKGMIVRHLVLPGCRKDSIRAVEHLADILPTDGVYLSIMSQYTPEFAMDCEFSNLRRRVTSFEYESVLRRADELGFIGFSQERSAATSDFTPEFYGE